MKRFLKILKWTGIVFGVLVLVYLLGPTPALPVFAEKLPVVQGSPAEIAARLAKRERETPRLKPDNQARIVWADSTQKQVTDICVVYLHGFFASYREGMPAVGKLAQQLKANLVCNRMPGHGIDDKDAFLKTSPEGMWASAQEALAMGKQLGKRVVLVGTSTGGTLALRLAAQYPEAMSAVVVYSPLIDFHEKAIWLLYKPWGLQIANLINGSPYMTQSYAPKVRPYWTNEYRIEGAIALANLVANTMHRQTFAKVKTAIFVGAYFKDEMHQDMVVSVPAIRRMYEQLGAGKKKLVLFPDAGHHVIGSDLRASHTGKVTEETLTFLKTIL